MYHMSLPNILTSLYPDHNWLPWKFVSMPNSSSYWTDIKNQRMFLDWVSQELFFKNYDQFYSVTTKV